LQQLNSFPPNNPSQQCLLLLLLQQQITTTGGRPSTILHPAYPGSLYHTTKCLDALLFQFFNKNDGIRVTDLHQGIVWGTNTPQTIKDERLINRFDYDGDYGTVLNRFIMQGALGVPLTVYGTGGQTRGFIHISDTARCIELAIANPPKSGEKVQIFNQVRVNGSVVVVVVGGGLTKRKCKLTNLCTSPAHPCGPTPVIISSSDCGDFAGEDFG